MEAVSEALRARHDADAAREAAILDCALDLLATSGYAAMSIDALARRARVSKATVYGRWQGKGPLVAAALRHAARSGDEPADTGALRSDLVAFGRNLDLSPRRAPALLLAVAHAAQTDAELAAAIEESLAGPYRAGMSMIVDRAVARGEIAPAARDLAEVAALLPSVVIARRLLAPGRPVDVERLVDTVLLPALRSGPSPSRGPDI